MVALFFQQLFVFLSTILYTVVDAQKTSTVSIVLHNEIINDTYLHGLLIIGEMKVTICDPHVRFLVGFATATIELCKVRYFYQCRYNLVA